MRTGTRRAAEEGKTVKEYAQVLQSMRQDRGPNCGPAGGGGKISGYSDAAFWGRCGKEGFRVREDVSVYQ